MNFNKTHYEKKEIIIELQKIINKSLIGKKAEIKYNNKIFKGIIINETKNTFILELEQNNSSNNAIEKNQIKSFIKSAIEIKTTNLNTYVPAKYFGDPILRLRHKIIFKNNKLI